MLNISNNSILDQVNVEELHCFKRNELPRSRKMFAYWLIGLLFVMLVIFFLPWTQNVQMKGKVNTYLPQQRPQDVNSAIAGRIEKWFVREGEIIEAGDTIAFLSEVKTEYFDRQLIPRTANQIDAKEQSIDNYDQKANALANQIQALRQELEFKRGQLENKVRQNQLKQESQIAAVAQADLDAEIAAFQWRRTDTLYRKGIKSLSDLEGKKLKMQAADAKLVAAKNKLQEL